MNPPSYAHLYHAGIHNMIDAAILWHLAECGIHGATTNGIQNLFHISSNSQTHTCLHRLLDMHLVAKPQRKDTTGRPCVWIISRLGYRLITGKALSPKSQGIPSITATT